MTTPFHLEEFSPGMKAKLDIKHRRNQDQQNHVSKFNADLIPRKYKAALPFTTKTKAYGTYDWRKKS
jgi:hypothetical protein